jgi:glucose-6-phosphate 1-epimerase
MHSWPGAEEAPGVVRCHEHGLEAVRADNTHGSLLVFRHGAQLVDWVPTGKAPVLWLSKQSRFEAGVPIRGGVPICFPWFGAHLVGQSAQSEAAANTTDAKLPAHGFARTRAFRYLGSSLVPGATRLSFELTADDATRALWPFEFRACLQINLGRELGLELEVENTGRQELEFEEALHTYFCVVDVRKASIQGLQGARYADKVSGRSELQREPELSIAGETDRVYQSSAACRLLDAVGGRQILVEKSGSASTVIWNPWLDKARRMSDFGDDEYGGMLCIESANIGDARIRLAPGESHRLQVTITTK